MPTLTIDGKTVQADHGTYLLAACRKAGIDVPTLCHHPAVEPFGGCRLCVVDVTRPEWNGWAKMVVACMLPVENGIVVDTRSARVIETRKVVLDLLLARCPETPLIRDLAAEHGILATSYVKAAKPTDCILCGLCTRVCDAMGMSAISSVNRGAGREISPPFGDPPPACTGCLACAEICPTGFIKASVGIRKRRIWEKDFEMLRCSRCGRSHITVAQADHLAGHRGLPRSYFETCDVCKRADLAATATRLAGESSSTVR